MRRVLLPIAVVGAATTALLPLPDSIRPSASVVPRPHFAVAQAAEPTAAASIAPPLRMAWQRAVPMGRTGDPATLPTLEPFSSPTVADLYGNGQLEVVSGGTDGRIHVASAATGEELGRFDVAPQSGTVASQPVVADINGDGRQEIVATFMPSARTPAGMVQGTSTVAAFTASGRKLWGLLTCQVPHKNCGVFASPVVTDIDGDGRKEVVVSAFDFRTYVLDAATGAVRPGWPRYLFDTSWATPVVADVDGDGRKEIIAASDLDGDFSCPGLAPDIPGCTYGGVVQLFDTAGNRRALFNVPGEVVWSSPAVSDVNGDGHPDVVVGTGQYFLNVGKPAVPSHRVWALDGRTLRPLPGFPVTLGGTTMSSPALASVDGGPPWLFINTSDGRINAVDGKGHRRWSTCALYHQDACGPTQAVGAGSPTVADVNGDGRLEVLTVVDRALVAVDALTGMVLQDTALGSGTALRPFVLQSSPTVVSIDGHAAVYLHGTQDASPMGVRDANDGDFLARFDSATPLGEAPWPTFHGLPTHEGTIAPPSATFARTNGRGRYVAHVFADFLGTIPSDANAVSGYQRQLEFAGTVGRRLVAGGPVRGSYYLGLVVDRLYSEILGRPATAEARADRVRSLQRGTSVETLAAAFYASSEYVAAHGGATSSWVRALYANVIQAPPSSGRVAYWTAEAMKHGRTGVARAFLASLGGRRVRAAAVYTRLLHRAPSATSLDAWADRLRHEDEVGLALELAVSATYFVQS